MIQRWWTSVLLLAGCGGGTASPSGAPAPKPPTSPSAAVTGFMRAVADSNLAGMASLWGTTRGPAARTGQPQDYERRIVVIQSYLRHDDYRVAADVTESPARHALQVELRRQACTVTVPMTAVQLGDGNWILSQIDLTQAGSPGRPCDPDAQADTTAAP